MAEVLKDLLVHRVKQNLISGHYLFRCNLTEQRWHSDRRIDVSKMYSYRDDWLDLVTDLILQTSTSGIIGIEEVMGMHWVSGIGEMLAEKGIELPVTEIKWNGGGVKGVRLNSYIGGPPVTIFQSVDTIGGSLRSLKFFLEKEKGINVGSAVSLINRNPVSGESLDNIPLISVAHIPLPLYCPSACPKCGVRISSDIEGLQS